MRWHPHQFVRRDNACGVTESLLGDGLVRFLYTDARARTGPLLRALTSRQASKLLAYVNFDSRFVARLTAYRQFLATPLVSASECLDPPDTLDTPRKFFERKLRYWECRPLPTDAEVVVSPADARVLIGSFRCGSPLFIKGKFFDFEELLGRNKATWLRAFRDGDWAIFRLTPDQYHYNHAPVSGEVVDFYEIPGGYHACNPGAVVELVTPYSKNKRVVTVIQTDVPGGTGIGLVAMIEVVALMIGEIVQCYSAERYDAPQPVVPGLQLHAGAAKSLYRPGSSTTVLVFEPRRVTFADDLVANRSRGDVDSRFSAGFGTPLVETDVKVRSLIARKVPKRRTPWRTCLWSWR